MPRSGAIRPAISYGANGVARLIVTKKRGKTALAARPALGHTAVVIALEFTMSHRHKNGAFYDGTAARNTQSTNLFVYDGWNLIAILSPLLSPLSTFTWGLDLSGSLQGAGGVGGLLWVSEMSNSPITNSSFAAYDGNGNVAALVSAS